MQMLKCFIFAYLLVILSGCTTVSRTTVKPEISSRVVTAAPGEVFLDYSDIGFFKGERTVYTVRSAGVSGFTLESNAYRKGINYSTKLALGEWQRDIGFQKKYHYQVTNGMIVIKAVEFHILSVTDGAISYRRVK